MRSSISVSRNGWIRKPDRSILSLCMLRAAIGGCFLAWRQPACRVLEIELSVGLEYGFRQEEKLALLRRITAGVDGS